MLAVHIVNWLFIQIDQDLRGVYVSLHSCREKMLREARRLEAWKFVVRKLDTWDGSMDEARDVAREILNQERRKAGYTGDISDRVRLRNWLVETGRLTDGI